MPGFGWKFLTMLLSSHFFPIFFPLFLFCFFSPSVMQDYYHSMQYTLFSLLCRFLLEPLISGRSGTLG